MPRADRQTHGHRTHSSISTSGALTLALTAHTCIVHTCGCSLTTTRYKQNHKLGARKECDAGKKSVEKDDNLHNHITHNQCICIFISLTCHEMLSPLNRAACGCSPTAQLHGIVCCNCTPCRDAYRDVHSYICETGAK